MEKSEEEKRAVFVDLVYPRESELIQSWEQRNDQQVMNASSASSKVLTLA